MTEFVTAIHLCLHCSFSKQVWHLVSVWTDGQVCTPTDEQQDLQVWWSIALQALNKQHRRSKAAIIIITAWNIWNERNRRVFQQLTLRLEQVFQRVQEEVAIGRRARASLTGGNAS
uniref:Uncharacterized protein n=1 Tax=Setaria viridis TaxID=4556 RepID=A0A4U6W3S4_SETVI|nr:hypothetical protein SEVIR_2G456600v2 [Setaria viridis]